MVPVTASLIHLGDRCDPSAHKLLLYFLQIGGRREMKECTKKPCLLLVLTYIWNEERKHGTQCFRHQRLGQTPWVLFIYSFWESAFLFQWSRWRWLTFSWVIRSVENITYNKEKWLLPQCLHHTVFFRTPATHPLRKCSISKTPI